MSAADNVTPVPTVLVPGGAFTVAHFNPETKLWHVESDGDGKVWTTDKPLAEDLVHGYARYGMAAVVKVAKEVVVGRLQFSGLVLIENEPEVKL